MSDLFFLPMTNQDRAIGIQHSFIENKNTEQLMRISESTIAYIIIISMYI